MYKRIALTLFMLALCILPASAAFTNISFATYNSDPIVKSGYYVLPNPAGICSVYGLAPFYADRLQKQFMATGGNPLDGAAWTRDASAPAYFSYPGNVSMVFSNAFDSGYPYYAFGAYCGPSGLLYGNYYHSYYNSTAYLPHYLNVNYTCNIVDPVAPYENPPFNLVCTDSSTAFPSLTQYNWTLTQPDTSVYTLNGVNTLTKTLTDEGWYGLSYRACNTDGCGYKNTTQLVNITSGVIPATGISFWVHIYDPLKSAKIANSDLIVRNTTSFSSFRYISSTVGSFLIDSTYVSPKEPITAGQYVNLTGIAPGYQTGNATVSVPYDGWEYNLNLIATADVPTGANATLIIQAIDLYTSQGVEGATITITNNTIPYSSSKLTNAGGSATFSNIAAGTYQISASKTGYQSSTTTWPAGASTVTSANIGLLPVGATPVVTGTSGNPLFDAKGNPIVGYDANGNPITAAPTQDTRTASEKDEGMADLLRNNGESLIMLFIVFTIIYMIKGIAK